ncbi:DUF5063 domain-containing protein [Carboxylicivirga sp. A043]|uniref:DUF5063 domain-containing protein n=1 Tax=Carboxylicivirga litoralis TaxID=2816963 RepID=UPI0021CB0F76|nr:DUF5063 domain-containing protein [Carboxylicivirga sp. A043]MCU4155452.1 DUF5063 domain-containing protein [Carboxylicivirga sp. A043]
MEESFEHIVYSKNVIEFVTVAKEYCTFLETADEINRKQFVTVATRIIPLLYLKASVLPKVEPELEETIEKTVDEMTYAQIQEGVTAKLGRFNDYLEVFNTDMQRSDTPVIAFIGEDMADIYQDLKDFISAYRLGVTEIMNDALAEVVTNFELYWGQRMVNTLRALHAVLHGEDDLTEEEGEEEFQQNQQQENWYMRMQQDWQDDNDEDTPLL